MSSLVMYIDKDFIIAAVVINEKVYIVKNQGDEFLWLYFYNDASSYDNKPTYGKANKYEYDRKSLNYIGLYDAINSKQTILINGVRKEALDLLIKSDLLNNIKSDYRNLTKTIQTEIPTRLVFSPSINEFTTIELVNYLNNYQFKIECFGIPFLKLAFIYTNFKYNLIPIDSSKIIFLQSSDTTLYVNKHFYDVKTSSLSLIKKVDHIGKGIDPRKKAVVKKVVDTINSRLNALNRSELDLEYIKKEYKADEWLSFLELQRGTMPICIDDSLSTMPNTLGRAILTRDDIFEYAESARTDIYDSFREVFDREDNKNLHSIILLGDLFRDNELVSKFYKNIENIDVLFRFENSKFYEILSFFPDLELNDGNLYQIMVDNESKIKKIAKDVRDEMYGEEIKIIIEGKIKKSEDYFEKAKALFAAKNFNESKVEINKAIDEYGKKEEYHTLLKEISKKIDFEKKIKLLIVEANSSYLSENYDESRLKIEEVLSLEPENEEAQKLKKDIEKKLLIVEANHHYNNNDWSNAIIKYKEVEKIIINDPELKLAIKKCEENLQTIDILQKDALELEKAKKYKEALKSLEALLLLSYEKDAISRNIKRISNIINLSVETQEIKTILEKTASDYKLEAATEEKKKNYKKAIELLRRALDIEPNDENIKYRIDRLNTLDVMCIEEDSLSENIEKKSVDKKNKSKDIDFENW